MSEKYAAIAKIVSRVRDTAERTKVANDFMMRLCLENADFECLPFLKLCGVAL